MKYKCTILILFITSQCFGQITAMFFESPIKWNRTNLSQKGLSQIGIDTISSDTIKVTRTSYLRIDLSGNIIEKLKISTPINGLQCSDDGYHLSGSWTAYYPNGNIKEYNTP